jgi:regulator of sigma E protease
MASMTVQSLYKLFTGQLSFKLLGSPIMIYKVAGNSYRIAGGGYFGWISFLSNLALLSITLGLVNLLPVPVLDGGHATFFIIEWIRGRPVSLRFMEIAMQVGLFLLIALFGLVLMNDIHRYQILESVLKLFR